VRERAEKQDYHQIVTKAGVEAAKIGKKENSKSRYPTAGKGI